ncbi:MAG: hypothetical protein AAFQ84_01350, partial [Pseudomonadota bacterium]
GHFLDFEAILGQTRADERHEVLERLVAGLPGHRSLANQEIEKLRLYGHGLGRPISVSDIRDLCVTDTDQAQTDLVALTLSGRLEEAVAALDRITIAGTSPISVLRALQRELARLIQAHGMAGTGPDVGMKLRPPVFRNSWPVFRKLMALWPVKRCARALERVHDAEAQAKRASALAEPALRQLIVDLARAAQLTRG